ncbi:rhodanese-like domain-containing protein [endosymbiont GvMRE of Glomus versiforme]|uniref:rhodanese-like domain-containing protein n=1 Tax=endosymbiont GvMRE of Glomus versiforme TaxID=2039283 RepID=UPI001C0E9F9A
MPLNILKLIIVYCNFGNRSGKVANFLREKGYFQTFVLERGIENYLAKDSK